MAEEKLEQRLNTGAIELPIVDISSFTDLESSTDTERQEIINKIEYGFSNTGFILLKGHQIDQQLLATTFDTNQTFFSELSHEILSSTVVQSPVPRGYAPNHQFHRYTENFGSLIGDNKPNDLNCKYRIGPQHHDETEIKVHKNKKRIKNSYKNTNELNDESVESKDDGAELLDYYGTKGARCLLYPNVWPSIKKTNAKYQSEQRVLKRFKCGMLKMYDELYRIAQILFAVFEMIFVDKYAHNPMKFNELCFNKHTSILSANYYPTKSEMKSKYKLDIAEDEQKRMAISEHTDIDIFTIIVQNNNEGGVQIKLNDEWLSVPYDVKNNYLVVNIGDGFQYLTNHKWKSTKHRVNIPQNNTPRQVIAFFAAFNYDAIMKPLIQRGKNKHCEENSYDDETENITYYQWRKKRIRKVVQQLKKNEQK
eukprot:250553_1